MPNYAVGTILGLRNQSKRQFVVIKVTDGIYTLREISPSSVYHDHIWNDQPCEGRNWYVISEKMPMDKFLYHKKRVEERHMKNAATRK